MADPRPVSGMSRRAALWSDIADTVSSVDAEEVPYDSLTEKGKTLYHLGKRDIKFDELTPQGSEMIGLISPRTRGMIESPWKTSAKSLAADVLKRAISGATLGSYAPDFEMETPPEQITMWEKPGLLATELAGGYGLFKGAGRTIPSIGKAFKESPIKANVAAGALAGGAQAVVPRVMDKGLEALGEPDLYEEIGKRGAIGAGIGGLGAAAIPAIGHIARSIRGRFFPPRPPQTPPQPPPTDPLGPAPGEHLPARIQAPRSLFEALAQARSPQELRAILAQVGYQAGPKRLPGPITKPKELPPHIDWRTVPEHEQAISPPGRPLWISPPSPDYPWEGFPARRPLKGGPEVGHPIEDVKPLPPETDFGWAPYPAHTLPREPILSTKTAPQGVVSQVGKGKIATQPEMPVPATPVTPRRIPSGGAPDKAERVVRAFQEKMGLAKRSETIPRASGGGPDWLKMTPEELLSPERYPLLRAAIKRKEVDASLLPKPVQLRLFDDFENEVRASFAERVVKGELSQERADAAVLKQIKWANSKRDALNQGGFITPAVAQSLVGGAVGGAAGYAAAPEDQKLPWTLSGAGLGAIAPKLIHRGITTKMAPSRYLSDPQLAARDPMTVGQTTGYLAGQLADVTNRARIGGLGTGLRNQGVAMAATRPVTVVESGLAPALGGLFRRNVAPPGSVGLRAGSEAFKEAATLGRDLGPIGFLTKIRGGTPAPLTPTMQWVDDVMAHWGNRLPQLKALKPRWVQDAEPHAYDYGRRPGPAGQTLSDTLRYIETIRDTQGPTSWGQIYNQAQESFYRALFFRQSVSDRLRAMGQNIHTTRISSLDPTILDAAITDALKNTMAYGKQGALAWMPEAMQRLTTMNSPVGQILAAGLRLTELPFPTYMNSALMWVLERPFLSAARLLRHPITNVTSMAKGTASEEAMRDLTKVMTGSAALGFFYLFRNSPYAGETWDTIKIPGVDKRMSITALGPQVPSYAFLGDLASHVTRWKAGDPMALSEEYLARLSQDAPKVLGMSARTGDEFGSAIVRGLMGLGGPLDNPTPEAFNNWLEKGTRYLRQEAGQIIGSNLTPIEWYRRLLAAGLDTLGMPEEAIRRNQSVNPFLGPIFARLPGLSQMLPPQTYPLTPGRQKRGLGETMSELVGFPTQEGSEAYWATQKQSLPWGKIAGPRLGHPDLDYLAREAMARYGGERVSQLLADPVFKSMRPQDQVAFLDRHLAIARQQAQREALSEQPAGRQVRQYHRAGPVGRRRLREQGRPTTYTVPPWYQFQSTP